MSLKDLDVEHLNPFRRALINVLSAPIAEFTFAQIVDGQPTSSVYADDHFFRDGLPTIQAYQTTLPGTVAWKLRLFELVATACHDIAVFLYQLDDGVHKHAKHQSWREHKLETLPEDDVMGRKQLPPPTLFWTGAYMDWPRYPNSLADMAGYWAEIQLFGGVILFDRGESEKECNGVYIHNQRYTTIAPPTEAQFKEVIGFLLSESPDYDRCPLPIEITPENKRRWDPYDARTRYHIFKHRHDIPSGPRPRRKDMITENTWPELIDHYKLAGTHLEGQTSDDAEKGREREKIAMTISPNLRLWEAFREEIVWLQFDEKKQGRPPYFLDSRRRSSVVEGYG